MAMTPGSREEKKHDEWGKERITALINKTGKRSQFSWQVAAGMCSGALRTD